MKIQGKLIKVGDVMTSANNFKRRNFVVQQMKEGDTEDLSFDLFQNNCSIIDGVNIGNFIEVDFKLKGRKWTDNEGQEKYFNTLQAWNITKLDG